MDEPIFQYTPEIDEKIRTAVADILHTRVTSAARIEKGIVNHVYRVEIAEGSVIARVFSRKSWPENGKLEWIDAELGARGIAHAAIRYLTRAATYFPYGFMIAEYIPGKDGWEAIAAGDISGEEFFKRLGATLHAVHGISIVQFGNVNNGKGTHTHLKKYLLELVEQDFSQLQSVPVFTDHMERAIKACIESVCERCRDALAPVLTHGDPSPHNTRLTPDGQVVLIDWDNAEASSFMRDIAALTYDGVHIDQAGDLDRLNAQWQSAFWHGYGMMNTSGSEREEIERMFHMVQAVRLLTLYAFRRKNPAKFEATFTLLTRLLTVH